MVLNGSGGELVDFWWEDDAGKRHNYQKAFEGVLNNLERRHRESESEQVREELEKYMNVMPCPTCQGARLKKEALFVRVGGQNIQQVTALSIKDSLTFFNTVALSEKEEDIARRILKEIRERLNFLVNVGLDYLSLDRSSGTLSGGEGQRIRLATQIGSSLVGVLYILDEPSIGLHQRDNRPPAADAAAPARHRQHGPRGGARRGDHHGGGLGHRHGAGRRGARRRGGGAGDAGGDHGEPALPDRPLPLRRALPSPIPKERRKGTRFLRIEGATENNLKDVIRRAAARGHDLHHRGLRLGQIDPGDRHALQDPEPAALQEPGEGGRGARASRGWRCWTR